MMNRQGYFHRPLVLVTLCVAMIVVSSGCAPLKKKFIRQKKKDKEAASDFVPVLEPEVYPVKTLGPGDIYAQQYSLFVLWISDFADNYETIRNDKRMLNDLESALKSVEEMINQLQSPLAEDLGKIKNQMVWVRDEYVKPASFRNTSRINSEVREIERNVRKNFKPNLVSEQFKQ